MYIRAFRVHGVGICIRIVVYLRGPRRSKIIIIVVMILQRPDVSPAVRLGGRKLSPSIHLGRARNSLSFVGGFPHSCHRRPPLFHLCISFVFFRFFFFIPVVTVFPSHRATVSEVQTDNNNYYRTNAIQYVRLLSVFRQRVSPTRTRRQKLFRAFHLQSQTNRRYNMYG